jgi:DNA-binding response OmpR family regulator
VGDDWVALSPGQRPIAQLLIARLGRVVRHDDLVVACAAAGHSTHTTALKAAVGRLERRLAPLGLRLRSIRARGYLLELDDDLGDFDAAVL